MMDEQQFDAGAIAELDTQVATTGALGFSALAADPIFEFTIGIVILAQ